jgi:pyridoxal 5'-phosphate synthase pdxS subunit
VIDGSRALFQPGVATKGSRKKAISNMTENHWEEKVGLARMLVGGVIMDVTNAEQAEIAERAGACAVMALERVPADIRREGGVARMAPLSKIREIRASWRPGSSRPSGSTSSTRARC